MVCRRGRALHSCPSPGARHPGHACKDSIFLRLRRRRYRLCSATYSGSSLTRTATRAPQEREHRPNVVRKRFQGVELGGAFRILSPTGNTSRMTHRLALPDRLQPPDRGSFSPDSSSKIPTPLIPVAASALIQRSGLVRPRVGVRCLESVSSRQHRCPSRVGQ
jgi:hypothetical protein